jgi:hypothetical protein
LCPIRQASKFNWQKNPLDIMLTFDGQVGLPIDERHTIVVRKDPRPVNMIVLPDRHFFDVLKTKLNWSGSRFKDLNSICAMAIGRSDLRIAASYGRDRASVC